MPPSNVLAMSEILEYAVVLNASGCADVMVETSTLVFTIKFGVTQ